MEDSKLAYSWTDMVDEFRSLGGTADNIVQRSGTRGRGIFPVDNSKSIRLHVPKNLLVQVDDIEFVDDRLKIRESSTVGAAERAFIERYENKFSWGGGGRSDCATFVEGMKGVDLDVQSGSFLNPVIKWAVARTGDSIGQRFLMSRAIVLDDKPVLMPVMELVNHDPFVATFEVTNGVEIGGVFTEEVLVRYSVQDPFGMFMNFGFASSEPVAFSLPINRKTSGRQEPPRQLVIKRDIGFKAKIGSFDVPEFRTEDGNVTLSCMLLGAAKAPRLPRSIFGTVLRDAGWQNWQEEFDSISHANRMTYLDMLDLLDAREGEFAAAARKAIRFQLRAMSSSIGTRPL